MAEPAGVVRALIRRGAYADSVVLMRVAAAARGLPGVEDVAVVAATPANREVLREAGLLAPEAEAAGGADVVAAVRAADAEAADRALAHLAAALDDVPDPSAGGSGGPGAAAEPPRSVRSAVRRAGGAALALISVPGPYAAAEARQALLAGLHAFVFSDNVPLEDEVDLKRLADERGLLVMGPDCGTAILDGVALGFANAVRRGPVGLVGASGTGLQEVTCLLHRAGLGISHAIGTGGRDLYEEVGGRTSRAALRLLAADPGTEVLVLVSKPASERVGRAMLEEAAASGKQVVACLLGAEVEPPPGVRLARNLYDAARLAAEAVEVAGGPRARWDWADLPPLKSRRRLEAGQRRIVGLFCGGTLRDEARAVIGEDGHDLVDFGDDRYTRGRPHPMIDPSIRDAALLAAAEDPTVAVILFDVVLGHAAHSDPAARLADVLAEVRARAAAAGREVALVCHVVGTDEDPQGLERQEALLADTGARLYATNHHAAVAASLLAGGA